MKVSRAKVAVLAILGACALRADLSQVMAEPNLERRSRAALEHADKALKAAREAYTAGDMEAVTGGLDELCKAVELADSSLKETGKNPSKSPKHFKHAEKEIRGLLKKLDAFGQDMNVGDRSLIDGVKEKLQRVQESILLGILGKKK